MTEEMGRTGYFIVVLALGFVIQMTALGFGPFAYTALLPGMKTDLGLTNTLKGWECSAKNTGQPKYEDLRESVQVQDFSAASSP